MTNGKPNRRTKTQIKVRLPNATHAALTAIAAALGMSLTEVVNSAARRYIEEAKARPADDR